MGKVGGSGASGGSKSRLRRGFYRFFSCVGLGSEAAQSFDHADAPVTPPVQGSDTADQPCMDTSFTPLTASPELPTSACDTLGFYPPTESEAAVETKLETAISGGDLENGGNTSDVNLAASMSDSLEDLDVADYVERCRSIRRHDQSFPDVFARVPGCRPKMLFDSHAAHLRGLAPWVEFSDEITENASSSALPEYDINEFGKVDLPFSKEAVDQSPNAQVRKVVSAFGGMG